MILSAEANNLLQAMKAKAVTVYEVYGERYYFRYDIYKRCTQEADELHAAGFLELPEFGKSRECTITSEGWEHALFAQ